jgi:hypothetical protein
MSIDSSLFLSKFIPENFTYPSEFLDYLVFEQEETEKNDGLSTSCLSFTWPYHLDDKYYRTFDRVHVGGDSLLQEILEFLCIHPRRKLIHFASENDRHWFFVNDGSTDIYVVDLAYTPWIAIPTDYLSFSEFIDDMRAGYDLPPWVRPNPSFKRNA